MTRYLSCSQGDEDRREDRSIREMSTHVTCSSNTRLTELLGDSFHVEVEKRLRSVLDVTPRKTPTAIGQNFRSEHFAPRKASGGRWKLHPKKQVRREHVSKIGQVIGQPDLTS